LPAGPGIVIHLIFSQATVKRRRCVHGCLPHVLVQIPPAPVTSESRQGLISVNSIENGRTLPFVLVRSRTMAERDSG
jgi:hypothetical protein